MLRKAVIFLLLAGVVALVGLSLYHQQTREPTLGQRVIAGLARTALAARVTAAPSVLSSSETLPAAEVFEFELNGRMYRVDRAATSIDVRGEVTRGSVVDENPRLMDGPELSAGSVSRSLSRQVRHVSIETAGKAPLIVRGRGYEATVTPSAAPLREAIEAEHPVLLGVLAQCLHDPREAARLIEAARGELRGLSDRALVDELLAADAALLAREDDPARVARRALVLALREPTASVILGDSVVIAAGPGGPRGGGRVRAYYFTADVINATVEAEASPASDPDRLRATLGALVGRGARGLPIATRPAR